MSDKILSLRQKMFREEARRIALKKNDWFWNLVFRNQELSDLRLMYIEYILLDLETTSSPAIIGKLRNRDHPIKKRMRVLVNGSTGGVALVMDRDFDIEEIELNDEVNVQHASFDEEEAIRRAKKLAHKISHRSMGGMHEVEIIEKQSLYRPFWVAFYGEMSEGNKVRYITIPADGGQQHRAR